MPQQQGTERMARSSASPASARARATEEKGGRTMVTPFARAMELLWAFTPQDRWLGNRELAQRTGLPPSTVSRIAQTLVVLGYLHYDAAERKYRLAPPVLALGYGAIANSGVQRAARRQMQALADEHRLHVNLSSRDRLDLIVLESCSGAGAPLALTLHAGVRVGIASSPMGWALLAALPELERYYLLENVERRMPREWPRLRRRSSEAIAQVHQLGFCTSLGEWDAELGIIAAPLLVEHHAPLVVACVGSSAQMTRARVERELGPKLLAAVSAVQQKVSES
ncbi:MAG: IclR family transcriptional regulator [Variovorax sp.]|nr:IclR family transcriptional regulator [Variovorax sp.]